nr:viral protein 4 [Rotavirus A]
MASLIYRQLLYNSYSVDLSDEITNIGAEKKENVTVQLGEFAQSQYAPVSWGSGETLSGSVEEQTLDGPYAPDSSNLPSNYWYLVNPSNDGVVFSVTDNSTFWMFTYLVLPNTAQTNVTVNVMNETVNISIDNSGSTYRFVDYIKTSSTQAYGSRNYLNTAYRLQAYKRDGDGNISNYWGADTQGDLRVGTYSNPVPNAVINLNADFYVIPDSQQEKCTEYIRGGLPAMQTTTYVTPISYAIRSQRVARPNEDIIISKASLWKEVQYNRDIVIRFVFANNIIKAVVLGYKWSEISYKANNYQYTYMRDGVEVVAHTTVSVNGVSVYNYNTGPLPTDFMIRNYDVLKESSFVYVDYWDDSQAFRNMVYVRSLNAELNQVRCEGGHYSFALPVGSWPVMQGGSVILTFDGVTLSNVSTDTVTLNSLRFRFRCAVSEPSFRVTGTRISNLYGLPAANPMGDQQYYEAAGRFSLISLVPSNDDYQTPIANSVTVRQDLERQLDEMRREFNELSANIALSQLIDLALLPLDMFSMFSGIQSTVEAAKSFATSVMKKFRKSDLAKSVNSLTDAITDAAGSISRSSTLRSVNSAASVWTDISDIVDSTDNVVAATATAAAKKFRVKEFTTEFNGVSFDDISAAVVKTKMNKLNVVDEEILPQIITEASEKFIPNRAYRLIDGEKVYEVTTEGKYFAYLTETFEEVVFDAERFAELVTDSPVISAIIDFKTIKNLNDNYGITREQALNMLRSDPKVLRSFINQNNPIIKNRIEQLILQCRI